MQGTKTIWWGIETVLSTSLNMSHLFVFRRTKKGAVTWFSILLLTLTTISLLSRELATKEKKGLNT